MRSTFAMGLACPLWAESGTPVWSSTALIFAVLSAAVLFPALYLRVTAAVVDGLLWRGFLQLPRGPPDLYRRLFRIVLPPQGQPGLPPGHLPCRLGHLLLCSLFRRRRTVLIRALWPRRFGRSSLPLSVTAGTRYVGCAGRSPLWCPGPRCPLLRSLLFRVGRLTAWSVR